MGCGFHFPGLILGLSLKQFAVLNTYGRIIINARMKKPHYYLNMIGVDPEYQGRGIGKKILHEVIALVKKDNRSAGLGLDTENKYNLDFYKSFGFKLISDTQLKDIRVYSLFLETKNNHAE